MKTENETDRIIVTRGPEELPTNWRHVSNLNRMTESELAKEGWFPVKGEQPSFSIEEERLLGPSLNISLDPQTKNIVATYEWKVVPKDINEIREEYVGKIKTIYFALKKRFFKDFDFDSTILRASSLIGEKGTDDWSDLKQMELKELVTSLSRFDELHKRMKAAVNEITKSRNSKEMKKVVAEYEKVKV